MTDWIDGQGRQIDYLRLSVTDRCDFRCVYCMAEDMRFLPRQQVLTLEEIERVARLFVAGGVRKLRLTGGEPLVRPGIVGLCERLAALPGLRELCMTSNGSQLVRYARPLYDAGLSRLNISPIPSIRCASGRSPATASWTRCWPASTPPRPPVSAGSS